MPMAYGLSSQANKSSFKNRRFRTSISSTKRVILLVALIVLAVLPVLLVILSTSTSSLIQFSNQYTIIHE